MGRYVWPVIDSGEDGLVAESFRHAYLTTSQVRAELAA